MPHIHEKIDFCSEVFIVYKDKVLLRKHDKSHKWLGPGGHIELDENPNIAAIREVKEEVGLDISLVSPIALPDNENRYIQLIPPFFLRNTIIDEIHTHIDFIYFAKASNDNITLEKKDDQCRWFTLSDLDKNEFGIEETNIFYAKKALEELGEK